ALDELENVLEDELCVVGLIIGGEGESEQGAAIVIQLRALFVERSEPFFQIVAVETMFEGKDVSRVRLRLESAELFLVLWLGEFFFGAVGEVVEAALEDAVIYIDAGIAGSAQALEDIGGLVRGRIIVVPPAPAAIVPLE